MKPEEQRIAIAVAVGRKVFHEDGKIWVEIKEGLHGLVEDELPDYLHNLNAMHEAEKILPVWINGSYQGTRYHYEQELSRIENPVWATAAQRAEAFLKTLGLWKY
jgi:hypothetical protein